MSWVPTQLNYLHRPTNTTSSCSSKLNVFSTWLPQRILTYGYTLVRPVSRVSSSSFDQLISIRLSNKNVILISHGNKIRVLRELICVAHFAYVFFCFCFVHQQVHVLLVLSFATMVWSVYHKGEFVINEWTVAMRVMKTLWSVGCGMVVELLSRKS